MDLVLLIINSREFLDDFRYEDMGSIFIDPDNDGDLDLYVVSGGVECQKGDKILQDRIYLNDGSGNFSRGFSVFYFPRCMIAVELLQPLTLIKMVDWNYLLVVEWFPGNYPKSQILCVKKYWS